MGINIRVGDTSTELSERITRSAEDQDAEMRARVCDGEMSLMDYLVHHKGYRPEHAKMLLPRFEHVFGVRLNDPRLSGEN